MVAYRYSLDVAAFFKNTFIWSLPSYFFPELRNMQYVLLIM